MNLHELQEQINDIIEKYESFGLSAQDIRVVGAIQPNYPLAVSVGGIFAPLLGCAPWNKGYLPEDGICPECGEPIGEQFATRWDDDSGKEFAVCHNCHDTKDQDGASVVWIATNSHPEGLNPYAPSRVWDEVQD